MSKVTMATLQLVSQGAEGRLFETTFLGKPCLMKERFKKAYRHPLLDEKLTNKRLTQEVILARLHISILFSIIIITISIS